MKIEDRK